MRQADCIFMGGQPPYWLHDALILARASHVRCAEGCAIVEMDEPRAESGGILLGEEDALRNRPDTGTVVFASYPFEVGDRVAVKPYEGKWVSNLKLGLYRSFGQTRIFGRQTIVDERPRPYKLTESIVLKLNQDNLKPTGRNLLIERPRKQATDRGIYLPDEEAFREPFATIVAVGPECRYDLQPGDRVLLLNSAIQRGQVSRLLFADNPDLAIIHEDGILAVEEP